MRPVTWRLLEVHYRDNPNVVGLDEVDDGIRERSSEVPSYVRRSVNPKKRGVFLDLRDELIDMAKKSPAQVRTNAGIPHRGILEVEPCFRMETGAHHNPTILRISAMT